MSILIIEDDERWVDEIKDSLISKLDNIIPDIGKSIAVSRTYEEGRKYLNENNFKLVIIDINLNANECNEESGLLLIEKAAIKRIPIIIISGTLTTSNRDNLYRDNIISPYLRRDYSKRNFYDEENNFIDTVREILLPNSGDEPVSWFNYKLNNNDKLYLLHILAKLAQDVEVTVIDYFNNLVEQLSLSEQLKQELSDIWIDNAGINSIKLINQIQDIDKNARNNFRQVGTSVLGKLIKIMLEKSRDDILLSIIQECNLIADTEIMANLENTSEQVHIGDAFEYDVFICHSSEDKQFIKNNILPKLNQQEVNYWFDDDEIEWGGNIPIEVQDGLKRSRYIMLCLSDNFLSSIWTQAEYSTVLMNIFSGSSKRGIKPLKIGTFDDEAVPELIKPLKYYDCSDQEVLIEILKSLKS